MADNTESGENLKWMYEGKNSSIDHEQYLLGKRITTLNDDQEDKGDFFVKSQQSSIATGNVTILEKLDYESKVREDPLFQIRKNDYEHRKELLSNPFKKKRIQNMLKRALERDLRKGVDQRSKESSSSSESTSSSSEDEEINKKLKDKNMRKLLKGQLEKDLKQSKNSSGDFRRKSRSKERDRQKRRDHDRQSKKERHRSRSPETRPQRREGYGLMYVKEGNHSDKPKKRRRERRTPTPEPEKPKYVRRERPGFSRKLSEKELEAKRREMMQNAEWRDDQRKINVKKFTKQEKEESEREQRIQKMKEEKEKKGGKVKDFLHDMKLHTATVGSLEDTVRRKKHKLNHKL